MFNISSVVCLVVECTINRQKKGYKHHEKVVVIKKMMMMMIMAVFLKGSFVELLLSDSFIKCFDKN